MRSKTKVFGIFVILFLALTIIIAVSTQSKKTDIIFQSGNSLEYLPNIITESVGRIKNKWNMSEDSVIVYELLQVDEQKRVQVLCIRLLDVDHTYYNITATVRQQNSDKIDVCIYNEGKGNGDLSVMEAFLQEGFPTEKYQMFWNRVQEVYQWEYPSVLQYHGMTQGGQEKEAKNREEIYLGDSGDGNYYCFWNGILNKDNITTDKDSMFFYFPAGE